MQFPEPHRMPPDLIIEVGRTCDGGWAWTAYAPVSDRAWMCDHDEVYETPTEAVDAARAHVAHRSAA